MKCPISRLLTALALLIPLVAFGPAWAGGILPPPQKVSEHVYAWIGPYEGPNQENRGFRMNLVFVVGSDGVAVLDTGYTRTMADEMIAHIRTVTQAPIRYAVNTNSQPHRHFGNDAFKAAGAEIITTPEEAERMADMGGQFAAIAAGILGLKEGAVSAPDDPGTLLDGERVLDLGGVSVRLVPAGANHTPNSLVAVIEADKVVYAGDLLYSGRLLAILPESEPASWIEGFDALRAFGGYTFIPGHGVPAPLDAFEFPTYSYLTLMNGYMTKAVEDEVPIDEATKGFDQSAYAKLVNFDQLAGPNASWAYQRAELDGF